MYLSTVWLSLRHSCFCIINCHLGCVVATAFPLGVSESSLSKKQEDYAEENLSFSLSLSLSFPESPHSVPGGGQRSRETVNEIIVPLNWIPGAFKPRRRSESNSKVSSRFCRSSLDDAFHVFAERLLFSTLLSHFFQNDSLLSPPPFFSEQQVRLVSARNGFFLPPLFFFTLFVSLPPCSCFSLLWSQA